MCLQGACCCKASTGPGPVLFNLHSPPRIRYLAAAAAAVAGVRNYVARNHLRAMKVGDRAFFYHSSCKVPGVVGIVEVSGLVRWCAPVCCPPPPPPLGPGGGCLFAPLIMQGAWCGGHSGGERIGRLVCTCLLLPPSHPHPQARGGGGILFAPLVVQGAWCGGHTGGELWAWLWWGRGRGV